MCHCRASIDMTSALSHICLNPTVFAQWSDLKARVVHTLHTVEVEVISQAEHKVHPLVAGQPVQLPSHSLLMGGVVRRQRNTPPVPEHHETQGGCGESQHCSVTSSLERFQHMWFTFKIWLSHTSWKNNLESFLIGDIITTLFHLYFQA